MTHFEPGVARAEVVRYTYTPTYQLSYLLGKVMLLKLRADEQARLGDRFRLRDFHDTMLRAGSLPLAFQRRILAGEGGSATGRTPSGVEARGAEAAPGAARADGAADLRRAAR